MFCALKKYWHIVSAIFIVTVLAVTLHPHSQQVFADANSLVYSTNFDAYTLGDLNGQDGWLKTNSGVWTVAGLSNSKEIQINNQGGYPDNPIIQSNHQVQDARVKVDFKAVVGGVAPQLIQRRSTTTATANFYLLYLFQGSFRISPITNNGGPSDYVSQSFSLTDNAWYTAEFEVINDVSGNPVLKAWIYPQGESRPGTPTLSYTDTSKFLPNAGYTGLTSNTTQMSYDNYAIYIDNGTPEPSPTPTPTPTPTSTPSPSQSPESNQGSSTTSSNNTNQVFSCSDAKPVGTVDVFQIDVIKNSATLYFSPVH